MNILQTAGTAAKVHHFLVRFWRGRDLDGWDPSRDAVGPCPVGCFAQAIEHASPGYEFEMWQLATHLTGPGAFLGELLRAIPMLQMDSDGFMSSGDLCWDVSAVMDSR